MRILLHLLLLSFITNSASAGISNYFRGQDAQALYGVLQQNGAILVQGEGTFDYSVMIQCNDSLCQMSDARERNHPFRSLPGQDAAIVRMLLQQYLGVSDFAEVGCSGQPGYYQCVVERN